jgi:hypothetical protein
MHPFVRRAIVLWLPVAAVSTVFAGVVYGAVQQSLRSSANDPQLQMAEDAATQLSTGTPPGDVATGATVDIARSLAPFVIVFDGSGRVLASTAQLDGETPVPPQGVLDSAAAGGIDVISWQPRGGVRAAIVVVPYEAGASRGTVLVGRSLRAVEERETNTLLIAGFAWVVALVGGAFAAGLGAFVWGRGDAATAV